MAILRPRALRILLLYLALTFFFTWPLSRYLLTHVPGDGIDDPALAWNLWWINRRLVHQVNFDIFHADWMFHPVGINLGFYTLTPLNGLLSVPLQNATQLVLASNLMVFLSFVLGGYGAYLLTSQELCRLPAESRVIQTAAFIAGIIYAFASAKLFYIALGQFNIASSHWIPFCALYLLRLARSETRRTVLRNATLAALFLSFQAWAELTYASFLILMAILAFCWSLFPTKAKAPNQTTSLSTSSRNTQHATRFTQHVSRITQHALRFPLLALLFLLGIAPFLWAMIPDLLREGDFFASGGGFADQYSADLAGYLLPTQLHPFLGQWVRGLPFPHDKAQHIYIGYTVTLLAFLGGVTALRQRATRRWGLFWISYTLFFWWLTLGAEARWLGESTGIPGPFALISRLPFFSGNRYPSRYSVMLLLGVAVLAGIGITHLFTWWRTKRNSTERVRLPQRQIAAIASVLIALFAVEHLSLPIPLSNFQTPAIYRQLADLPTPTTLLELPTGWRNGARVMGKSDLLIMFQQWYQTTHGQRRLGGNTSRNPRDKFQYFTNAPLLGDLIALMNANPDTNAAEDEIARVVDAEWETLVARNRPIAGEVLDFLDVGYITVHEEKSSPALLRFMDEVMPITLVDTWRGVDWSGATSTIRLYQPNLTPHPSQWTIDLDSPLAPLYLAEGWSALPWQGARYTTRPCATLLLDLPATAGTLTLVLTTAPTTLRATINERPLTHITTTTDPALTDARLVSFAISSEQASAPVDRLQLCADDATAITALATPPATAGWSIGETGVAFQHSLFVQSAGSDVGNFAEIRLNGDPLLDDTNSGTGYNLVALTVDGQLLDVAHVNTLASAAASDALAGWIAQWPAETVIAGAVMDEASLALTQTAVDALATIGVATDLRDRFRWSHAFVGAVGVPTGSALEQATLLQPAIVAVGVPIDRSSVYLGLARVAYKAD